MFFCACSLTVPALYNFPVLFDSFYVYTVILLVRFLMYSYKTTLRHSSELWKSKTFGKCFENQNICSWRLLALIACPSQPMPTDQPVILRKDFNRGAEKLRRSIEIFRLIERNFSGLANFWSGIEPKTWKRLSNFPLQNCSAKFVLHVHKNDWQLNCQIYQNCQL